MSATATQETRMTEIQDLAAELLRQNETKADYIVDTRRMHLHSDDDGMSSLHFDTHDGVAEAGFVKERAHRQIGERLEIPRPYYKRMQAQAPALLDENVNHWFHEKPSNRMVRMLEGNVRAFLSNRYRRVDNLDIVERAVLPVFMQHDGGLVLQQAVLDDDRLYIRALLPSVQEEIKVGDIVQAGVEIRNSEVGAGQTEVAPFIWRLVCSNGMKASDRTLSRYHVGRAQEAEAFAIYRDDTLAADDAAFMLKVRDAVDAALSDVTFGEIVRQLRETTTGEKVADTVAATEKLAKTFTLDKGETKSVMHFLAEGGDLSRWGMLNAVTAAAKKADTFERQAEMEAIGGEIAALDQKEWAAIVA